MLCSIHTFLEFCYIARWNVIDTSSLAEIKEVLSRFHHYHKIFEECGVRTERFNLPRQHFIVHYAALIRAFGAPNGLCSSIMKSKHIKAVKQPWRCLSHYKALSQMLLSNVWLDKIAACRADFVSCGMLDDVSLSGGLHIYELVLAES
jgi:hypothetical protein